MRWGMVIDLKACIGCNACTLACKVEHATPMGIYWGKVLEKEVGVFPTARRVFLPVLCNHCREPACEKVCPSGATYKRSDGVVLIDAKKCIGCRACMEACPYGARSFFLGDGIGCPDGPTPFEEKTAGFEKGTVQKCDFCFDRVQQGSEPACVETCPTSCRFFGDLEDPKSRVAQLAHGGRAFQLLPDKGLDPSVFYLH